MPIRFPGRVEWPDDNHELVTTFTAASDGPVFLDLDPGHANSFGLAYFAFESRCLSSDRPDGGRGFAVFPYSSDPSLSTLDSTHWNFDYPELNYTAYFSSSPEQLRVLGDPGSGVNATPSEENDYTVNLSFYYDTEVTHSKVLVFPPWAGDNFGADAEDPPLRKYGTEIEVTVYEYWFESGDPDPGSPSDCGPVSRVVYPYKDPRPPSVSSPAAGVRRTRRRVL